MATLFLSVSSLQSTHTISCLPLPPLLTLFYTLLLPHHSFLPLLGVSVCVCVASLSNPFQPQTASVCVCVTDCQIISHSHIFTTQSPLCCLLLPVFVLGVSKTSQKKGCRRVFSTKF